MNSPEHESVGDCHLASQLVSVLLEHVEVGFGDCGRTWYRPVGWAAKGDIEVLFITSDLVHGWCAGNVTKFEFFAATRQNDNYVAAINPGNGAQIGLKRKQCLRLVFFMSEHGIGRVVFHDAMTGVINEVEGGLLATPGILDIFDDKLKLFLELLCVCIVDDFAGTWLEANAFKALRYVL